MENNIHDCRWFLHHPLNHIYNLWGIQTQEAMETTQSRSDAEESRQISNDIPIIVQSKNEHIKTWTIYLINIKRLKIKALDARG